MKIRVFSDLHLEFAGFEYEPMDEDVVILAGDIHVKGKGVAWAKENLAGKPVLYVLGNHEFYGRAFPKHIGELKAAAAGSTVQILEKDVVTVEGVNFLGCTLWTDFALLGDPAIAGTQCQQIMTDYKKIRLSPNYAKLWSKDLARAHRRSLDWLGKTLVGLKGERNVVITHHAPSARSLPSDYASEVASAAYASSLEGFTGEFQPDLWIHGHIHRSQDYWIGACRVVCNPRGYSDYPNPAFQADLIVELDAAAGASDALRPLTSST